MSKKVLKGMVKNYFSNNNRMMGIFTFTYVIMILMITLMNNNENKWITALFMTLTFLFILLIIFGKVWLTTLIAFQDIKRSL